VIRIDQEAKIIKAPVRALASAMLPGTKLMAGGIPGTAALSVKIHSLLQEKKIGSSRFYSKEETVEWETSLNGFRIMVEGRIDLVHRRGKRVRVEEIKGMVLPRESFNLLDIRSYPEFIYQAQIYAFLLSQLDPGKEYQTRILLVNLHTNKIRRFDIPFDEDALREHVVKALGYLADLPRLREQELEQKREWGAKFVFPLREKRMGQQVMMEKVTEALTGKLDLLASAPTGIGKTAGALYPAVSFALERGKKIFFLTSKNTQRNVVEQTIGALSEQSIPFRTLFLGSRESMCPNHVQFCHETICALAEPNTERGAGLSISDLFSDPLLTVPKVEALARGAQVCPVALSRALAEAADMIVCDYNFVFDPNAYLRRFFDEPGYDEFLLIIDEAHNLYDRGRRSFSAELKLSDVTPVIKSLEGLNNPGCASFAEFLGHIGEMLEEYRQTGEIEYPEQSQYLCDLDLSAWLGLNDELDGLYLEYLLFKLRRGGVKPHDPVVELYTRLKSFIRTLRHIGPEFRFLFHAAEGGALKVLCLDPSRVLGDRIRGFHSTIAMSATLEPLGFFRDVLGFDSQRCLTLTVPSPFPPENRLFVIVDSISTRFKDRMKSYMPVAELIRDVVKIKPGNYLAFFPSFDYLKAVRFFLAVTEFEIIEQRPGMDEKERADILRRMEVQDRSVVLMAVSGGVFSEGVDFAGDRAIGAFVVSPSLPVISNEQELLKDYYDRKSGMGFEYAYRYPGMNKVIQSAGRVIRSRTDKGVIALVCDRFTQEAYTRLMPEDWYDRSPLDLVAANPLERIRKFWTNNQSNRG